jgi:hypothetical protein
VTSDKRDALLASIEKSVKGLYLDHHAGCPAIMRESCTCGIEAFNIGIVQAMHRVRFEVGRYFDAEG